MSYVLGHRPWAVFALVALLAVLAACGSEPEAPAEVYRSRGVVRQLPDPGKPGSELMIHHEALPEFRAESGEVVGMESMVMPFAAAETVSVAELAAGDRIAFEFEMRWEGPRPLVLTRVEKLPPGTRLAFEEPAPTPAQPEPEP